MTLLALCSLESDLETFLTIHCYSFLYVLYMYLSAYCLSFPKIYFVHIISIDKLKKCEKYRFLWYSVILKLVSFYLCNCHSLFFYCGTEIFLILTILQMDFMVVKKINYKIEKNNNNCSCANAKIYEEFLFFFRHTRWISHTDCLLSCWYKQINIYRILSQAIFSDRRKEWFPNIHIATATW